MEISAKAIIIAILIVVCLPLNSRNQMEFSKNIAAHDSTKIHEIGTHPRAVTVSVESGPSETNIVSNPASVESSASTKSIAFSSNYTFHSPINITSDEEFAIQKAAEGWEGNGTEEDPFIIQGYNITFNGVNIVIINVSAYFEIRDCLLISTNTTPRVGIYDEGIAIVNSTNGAILSNVFLGGDDAGIFVGMSNCTVMGNQFDQFNGTSSFRGIIFYNSTGTVIDNELLNYEEDGIWIFNSSYLEIASNSITGGVTGISILNSNDIDVRNNSLSGGPRIWAYNLRFCSFASNMILDSETEGIWLQSLDSCSVSNNEILNCGEDGIQVSYSSDVDLRLNSVTDCGRSIYLGYSNEIQVSDNTLVRGWGVMLDNLEDCSVTKNEILFASHSGIWDVWSTESMISQNVIQSAENYGIYTTGSIYCSYTANHVSSSQVGINILGTDNSIFSYNHLVYNDNYGIKILYGEGNSLYGNLLGGLGSAIDDGHYNIWDDGERIGNCWSDVYSLSPVSIDGEADAEDRYPLLFLPPDFQMPIITCPPIIRPLGMSGLHGSLTWVIWSSPCVYAVYHNEQQVEAGVWNGSGCLIVSTNTLSDGDHRFRLVVTDDESRTGTSTATIRVPGFECLNDADEDGMYDLWEIEHGFNPMYGPDASWDHDFDKLTNLEEQNHGTDPHSSDSDGDSLSDFWEVSNGFDPLNPDIPFLEYVVFFRGYVIGIPTTMVLLGAIVILGRRLPEETKSRFPIKGPISYRFWLKLSIIFCVLLLVPSEIHYREEFRVDVPYYYFSMNSVFMYFSRWQDAGNFDIVSLDSYFIEPITLLSAIVILLPGIYLIRKLRNRPADAPILDLGLAALFPTIILTFWFAEHFPPPELLWAFQSIPSWSLMYFGTLVIVILILLPLFSREAFLWREERVSEDRGTSGTRIPRVRRYSLAGYAWGLATFLLPLVATIQPYEFDTFSFHFESPLYVFELAGSVASIPGSSENWMIMSLDVYQVFDFVNFLVASVFHIVFAFHVLRYLRGMMSRKRVIQLGILSMIAPIMYHAVIAASPITADYYSYPIPIPIPIVLIIGLVATMMIKPNVTRIRAEEFEKGDKSYPDIPEDDGSIQVPLFYYFKSKLRNILRRRSKSNAA